MGTQYQDGTFSDTKPFQEAMEKFLEAVESGTAKAFHVGSKKEIEKVKRDAAISDRVDELTAKVAELERAVEHDPIIHPVTREDIQKYSPNQRLKGA